MWFVSVKFDLRESRFDLGLFSVVWFDRVACMCHPVFFALMGCHFGGIVKLDEI